MATPEEQATQIVSDYQTQVEKIQSNIQLSAAGKRPALAKAYIDAVDKVRAVKDARDSGGRTRRQQLEQTLFGMPNASTQDAVSYRDALDRVQRITLTD